MCDLNNIRIRPSYYKRHNHQPQ